jgi:predicted amidohydrolase
VEANLSHFKEWVAKAAEAGAELVCLPELAVSGYGQDPALRDVAESIPGESTRVMEAWTARYGVHLSVGMLEKAEGVLYNAQVLLGPEGYLGHYRKRRPTPDEINLLGIRPGWNSTIHTVRGARLGMNICADSRSFEPLLPLVEKGMDVLHNPHSNKFGLGKNADEWERGKIVYYLERIAKARCHMLVNNMAGSVKDTCGKLYEFSGGALILDPLGQVVARSGRTDNEECMVVARIDTDLKKYVPAFEALHGPLKTIERVRTAFAIAD